MGTVAQIEKRPDTTDCETSRGKDNSPEDEEAKKKLSLPAVSWRRAEPEEERSKLVSIESESLCEWVSFFVFLSFFYFKRLLCFFRVKVRAR